MLLDKSYWTTTPISNVGKIKHEGEDITGKIPRLTLPSGIKAQEIYVGKPPNVSIAIRMTIDSLIHTPWTAVVRHCRLEGNDVVPYLDTAARDAAVAIGKYGSKAESSSGFFALHYHFGLFTNVTSGLTTPSFAFLNDKYNEVVNDNTFIGFASTDGLYRRFFQYAFSWLQHFDVKPSDQLYDKIYDGYWPGGIAWKAKQTLVHSVFPEDVVRDELLTMCSVGFHRITSILKAG